MHLGFIAKRFDTVGGTEKDLFEVTRLLASYGHDVHVHAAELRATAPAGVTLHEIPVGGRSRIARLRAVSNASIAITNRGEYDLTISYARTARADVVRCGGGTHKAFLADMQKGRPAWKGLLRTMDPYHRAMLEIEAQQYAPGMYRHVIAIAENVKRDVMETYNVPDDRISVIYDGIDIDAYRVTDNDPRRAETRRALQIAEDAPVVLFVGNAFRRKGLDALIRSVAASPRKDLHLVVVGRDPESAAYEALARDTGIGQRTRFVGQQDPRPYYAASDVVALVSINEAFGNVVLEALTAGRPVVVSRAAGASSILTGSLANLIVDDPTSAPLIAEKIDAALSGNFRAEAEALASRFSIESHARATEALLKSVVS